MPDDNSLRDAVRRSAHGHFAEHPGESDWQISQRIIGRLGIPPGGDRVRVFNFVRGARREYDAAREADQPGQSNTPFKPTNVDPSLGGEMAEYRYRTVVEIIDPATGEKFTTVVPVSSTVPLTPQQIKDDARASWTTIRGPNRDYLTRGELSNMPDAEVYIVGGGRRG